MSWIDVFIRRPILTWMLTLSLIVFGVLGLVRLGVDQYPKMEFPTVMVSAFYEGATPEVMEEDVTEPLEEQLNTIEGVKRLQSSSRQERTSIGVEFELGTDLDTATQDVRDRVERARFDLPDGVESPVVSKRDFSGFPIMWIPLMTDRPQVEASEFVRRIVKPKVETVAGVAGIEVFGELDRSIRIWMDGEALRARGLAATDVIGTLSREHVERPGGLVEGGRLEFSVKTEAEYQTVDELAAMVVAYENGSPVRLRDVARVEDGSEDQRFFSRFDGVPAVGIGVIKTSDGNTVAVADGVLERIARIQETLPNDMHFKQGDGVADFSRSIREAVSEAIFSLWFGALLATLTVFVFLRRFRPTLVVALAIPFSLITTFGVMWLLDYTLNTMTILALTLAVGVVIDDAIVVLENIERHREELGEEPAVAASNGTKEIAFAATAATVSIAVVFLPVIFVGGMVGNFLAEFGATVAAAVMISLVVALTLTPMLAARIPAPKERSHGSIYNLFDRALDGLEARYRRMLHWAVAHRAATLGVAALTFAASFALAGQLGAEFFPSSDEGRFFVAIETPPGTSPEGTLEQLKMVEEWVFQQPEVAGAFSGAGTGGSTSGPDPTRAIMFVMLKNRAERERSAGQIIEAGRAALAGIAGMKLRMSDMSGFGGHSDSADLELDIQGNVELETLDDLADRLIAALEKLPGYVDLDKNLKLGSPEVRVIPDRAKAAALGVDAEQLATTVQAMIGGLDVATFKEAGNRYDIRVRLEEKDRTSPEALLGLFVRTRSGDVVELRNLVRLETGAAPSAITRVDRLRSVRVSANLEGKDLGTALEEAQQIAAVFLPEDVRLLPGGGTEEFQKTFQELSFAMILAILVIYMILAAQFESLVHPLTVMLALPLAMVGAYGGLYLKGMTLNIFSMIGIILLFGLATKSSILLVDYANQLREQGMDKVTAITTAAPIRMRPVLMTALSMIFGVAPAALGLGPGAETRAPMAVATGAGMISSTALTLLIVPVFYLTLDDGVEWVRSKLHRRSESPPKEAAQTA